MLFQDGTPNLIDRTRYLAGNPAAEPSNLFAIADIKAAINLAYEELMQRARHLDVGWGVALYEVNSTSGTSLYADPTDLDGKILSVQISEDSTLDADTNPSTHLRAKDAEMVREMVNSGTDLTTCKYYYKQGAQFGIGAAPTVTGTAASGNIAVYYQQEITWLVADADEPLVPQSHRDLICLLAAMDLRAGKDLGYSDLAKIASRKFPEFIESMQEPLDDYEDQMTAVGRTPRSFATKSGFSRRV